METSRTPPHGPRVLVVDDEALLGSTIRRSLAREYDVTVVDSGARAIEVLSSDRAFDCVLCDLQMPDVSGMDVYAWAERHAPTLLHRFVFMTGGSFTERAHTFLARNACQKLDKPFDAASLRSHVAQICGTAARTTV